MTRQTLILAAAASLLSSAALAQEEPEPTAEYAKETHVDFVEREVSGRVVGPGGRLLAERSPARFPPMIKLREDFNPEIDASVEQVK